MTEEVKGLREELGSLLDAAENADGQGDTTNAGGAGDSTPPPVAAVDNAPVQDTGLAQEKDDRPRDASGRFLPKSDAKAPDEKIEPTKVESVPQEQPKEETLDGLPPSTWTPAAKAVWKDLPELVRKEINRRESDAIRGITKYKQPAELGERMMKALEPHQALLKREGVVAPEQAVGNALAILDKLGSGTPQERAAFTVWLGQQYGADFSALQAPQQAGEQRPNIDHLVQRAIAPYLQQFQGFKAQAESAEQQRKQEFERQVHAHIDAFRTAKDEKGNPKHLYFDTVWPMMQGMLQSRQAQNLDVAYDMACHAHPEVRTALTAERQKQDEAKRLDEARKRAADAARATAANVTGQGGVGIAGTTTHTLRDELSSHYDNHVGARI